MWCCLLPQCEALRMLLGISNRNTIISQCLSRNQVHIHKNIRTVARSHTTTPRQKFAWSAAKFVCDLAACTLPSQEAVPIARQIKKTDLYRELHVICPNGLERFPAASSSIYKVLVWPDLESDRRLTSTEANELTSGLHAIRRKDWRMISIVFTLLDNHLWILKSMRTWEAKPTAW